MARTFYFCLRPYGPTSSLAFLGEQAPVTMNVFLLNIGFCRSSLKSLVMGSPRPQPRCAAKASSWAWPTRAHTRAWWPANVAFRGLHLAQVTWRSSVLPGHQAARVGLG